MVITIVQNDIASDYTSLAKITVESQLDNDLLQDYGLPRMICQSRVDFFSSYFDLYRGADRSDGQLIYRVIPSTLPPTNVKTEEVITLPVRLSLYVNGGLFFPSFGG